MRKHVGLLLLLAVVAACPSFTPQEEADFVYYTSLSSYNEAVKFMNLWTTAGKVSLKDANQFEELRAAASEGLAGMKAAIAVGDYTAVSTAQAAVQKMILFYIARKKKVMS